MKKFILEWIASVKEQERIKKQKLKKDISVYLLSFVVDFRCFKTYRTKKKRKN